MNTATTLLNPSDLTNEQLDRIAFALLGKINNTMMVEKPLTVEEAASYLRITRGTLYQRIKDGKIPGSIIHRQEGSVYFFTSELYQLLKKS